MRNSTATEQSTSVSLRHTHCLIKLRHASLCSALTVHYGAISLFLSCRGKSPARQVVRHYVAIILAMLLLVTYIGGNCAF